MEFDRSKLTLLIDDRSLDGALNGLHPNIAAILLRLNPSTTSRRNDTYTALNTCCGSRQNLTMATIYRRSLKKTGLCISCARQKRYGKAPNTRNKLCRKCSNNDARLIPRILANDVGSNWHLMRLRLS